MTYSRGLSGRPLTAAQVNAANGWTPKQLKAYWDAKAKACTEFGDEGECLAQVARHVPVTIGGLGSAPQGHRGFLPCAPGPNRSWVTFPDTPAGHRGAAEMRAKWGPRPPSPGLGQTFSAQDAGNIAAVAAQLIANPEGTMRVQGPRIVASLDQYLLTPAVDAMAARAVPYLVGYLGPPIILLYIMTGVSTYFSFQVLQRAEKQGLSKNRGRRKKRRRRSD